MWETHSWELLVYLYILKFITTKGGTRTISVYKGKKMFKISKDNMEESSEDVGKVVASSRL